MLHTYHLIATLCYYGDYGGQKPYKDLSVKVPLLFVFHTATAIPYTTGITKEFSGAQGDILLS